MKLIKRRLIYSLIKKAVVIAAALFLFCEGKMIRKGCVYPTAPMDDDLIIPVFPKQMEVSSIEAGSVCLYRPIAFILRSMPFEVLYELESGDFEVINYINHRPNWWQRLKIRYKIWRLRRKIRKALAKR